jgi:beta-mannosidase
VRKKKELSSDWQFIVGKENPSSFKINDWLSADVPGTIHTDLLNHKLIEEPFYNDNEKKLVWISETDWSYQTTFNKPEDFSDDLPVYLIFEGLDTVADIFFNGNFLGRSVNMFLKYNFEISSLMKEKDNLLEVQFKSPIAYAKSLEKKFGKLPVALNSERVYIRKAQYSFGWDWGPSFPTMGLFRPVYLEQRNNIFIKNISFSTTEIQDDKAKVIVKIKLNDQPSPELKISLILYNKDQKIEKSIQINSLDHQFELEVENPDLWWPNGEGNQALYNLTASLFDDKENEIDSIEKKVGIRTVSLQLKDEDKSTFRFLINGKAIFAKGVNWIPSDSFLPRVSKEKYETLLSKAKDANMNFVRVWGGGFYENDIFYELCDELGLLVWQDFMFACASYPEHEEFLKNVEDEVKQNIVRLQHHPSIAVWCGNNENEWIWYQETKTSYKEMPGYKIYHELIPEILKEIDPFRPYWPSSPFGSDDDPNSHSSGNRHEWGIWSKWIDYSEVKNDNSLFVTEFGFQGPANKKTFEKFLSDDKRYSQDPVFEFHNKQVEGPERVFKFLSGNLPIKTEWEDFIYLAQLNQALALKTCLEHWRINWPVANGSIIWQLNDCWPVTSWSIIDSELLPKISYHFVKNIFHQNIIGFSKEEDELKIIAVSHFNYENELIINLDIIADKTGEMIFHEKLKSVVPAWSKKVVHRINLKEFQEENKTFIVSLVDINDRIIFRNFYTARKWKYKTLPKPEIEIDVKNENKILVKTDIPAFFVDLYHPEIQFNDRGFIILPGEKKDVTLLNSSKQLIKKEEIKIFSLNNYLCK